MPHDKMNRLVDWNAGANMKTFEYDNIGNRLFTGSNGFMKTYSYNDPQGPNRLTSFSDGNSGTTNYAHNNNGAMNQRQRRYFDGELWRLKGKFFEYDPRGPLKKYSFMEAFSLDSCSDINDQLQYTGWRYAYNPLSEREQKRLYTSMSSDGDGNTYPWAYYLLGGNNEQYAFYHGVQQSDANIRFLDGTYRPILLTNAYLSTPLNIILTARVRRLI